MKFDRDYFHFSIARIEGSCLGVAFLVAKYDSPRNGCHGHWLTCTHVCGEDGHIKATISTNCLHPNFSIDIPIKRERCLPTDREDIALLHSLEPLPDYLRPLSTLYEYLSADNPIALYGFPEDSALHGALEEGQLKNIASRNNQGCPQVSFKSINVSVGFSGSPIVDSKLSIVIGMVSEVADPDDIGRRGRSVFGAPISFIGECLEELRLFPLIPFSEPRLSTQAMRNLTQLNDEHLNQLLSKRHDEKLSIEHKSARAEKTRRSRDQMQNLELAEFEHGKYVDLFYDIVGSAPLTNEQANNLNALVDDDRAPWHQKCIVVSALTLSSMKQLDKVRLRSLLNFLESGEEEVWQRALTGLLFTLSTKLVEIERTFPHLVRRMQRLQTDSDIQIAIRHFYDYYHSIDIKSYVHDIDLYHKDLEVRSTEEFEIGKKKLRNHNLDGDDLALYLILQDFRQDKIFKNPYFWFLPFHKDNKAAADLLNIWEDVAPSKLMMELLADSVTISNSQKYAICYAYPELTAFQALRLREIFQKEKLLISGLEKKEQSTKEYLEHNVFKLILDDIYQFQLFFAREWFEELQTPQQQEIKQSKVPPMIATETWSVVQARKHFQAGYRLHKANKLKAAREYYQKAVNIKPDFYEAWNHLGNAYHDEGMLNRAVSAYRSAIAANQTSHQVWDNLGSSYLTQGAIQEAESAYLEALRLNPNYANANINYGHCLLIQGQLIEALARYRFGRNSFENKLAFFNGMREDYTNLKLEQYSLEEATYFHIVEQLREEVKGDREGLKVV